jgi:hypothetical protein
MKQTDREAAVERLRRLQRHLAKCRQRPDNDIATGWACEYVLSALDELWGAQERERMCREPTKSEMLLELAEKHGWKIINIPLVEMSPHDLRGFPFSDTSQWDPK